MTLRQSGVEADTSVIVNAYNEKSNLPGIYEEYQKEFKTFLFEKPIPYIKSLKRLTADIKNYAVQTNVKNRLEFFIEGILAVGGYHA